MDLRHLTLFCTLLLTACDQTWTPSVVGEAPAPATSEPITLGQSYTLMSDVFGGPREINIYVPDLPGWADGYFDDPLPVLYVVDGGLEQDFIHLAGLSHLPLINAERSPAIIVGVKTDDRYGEITPEPTDPRYIAEFEGYGGADTFRRFLRDEVQPFVRSLGHTGRRALMGESLAGLFVLDTLAAEPDLFDDYIAISPSSWWDDRKLAKSATETLADTPIGKRLVLAMANEGGTMEMGTLAFRDAAAADPAITLSFLDRSGSESHSTIYHDAARDALILLHGIAAEPYGDMPWYLIEGEEPPTNTP